MGLKALAWPHIYTWARWGFWIVGPLLIKTIHGNAEEIQIRKDNAGRHRAYLQLELAAVYTTLQPPAMSGIPAYFSAADLFCGDVVYLSPICACLHSSLYPQSGIKLGGSGG